MDKRLLKIVLPCQGTKYLFFGGKGGVGKTTLAASTAVWLAEHNYKTTIVSTDPTVSLSAVFDQEIRGVEKSPIRHVANLCGMNLNPADARGVFQKRLNSMLGQISGAFGQDIISTPCMEEMATFDQFVGFLEEPDSEMIVFDTAPTGKTLRELAIPFDWAGFLQKQAQEGKKLSALLNAGGNDSFEDLERDRKRYDRAIAVLRNSSTTIFSLVLLPEKLPIEETQSAISGLAQLGVPVQSLVVNQCILDEVIEGNRFLEARAKSQSRYLDEIGKRFTGLIIARLPLLDHDVSNIQDLRRISEMLYGK